MNSAYAFDLKLVCGGYGYFSTFTIGSEPGLGGLEARKPRLVDPDLFAIALQELGLTYHEVHDEESFYDWTCIQGWALAERDFVRKNMTHWIKKRECLISPFGSFTDIALASPSVRKRTFRGKFKERIVGRDGNQCVLCKCSTELTLQHVRPYSQGGETSSRNLVTLCEPCNQRMGAESNRELYDLAGLRHSYDPTLAKASDWSDRAIIRAARFSRNIMYTRCELY